MLQRTFPAGFIAPCLPTKTDKLPSGDLWLHEIKHDGFRVIARKTGRQSVRRPFGNGKAISIISMKAELI
jgi:ATP-dependent DNA ligase